MSSPPDFDRLYADDPDPWRVATSWYERRKIAILLASLRRERYRLAWDAASGTGELAAVLAGRCDAVVASDLSQRACELTRERVADLPGVEVHRCALPAAPPMPAAPDLVVLSEVLYYLDPRRRARARATVLEVAAPDADVVAVHWAQAAPDMHAPGTRVQLELDEELREAGWGRLVAHVDTEFALSLWSRELPDHLGR